MAIVENGGIILLGSSNRPDTTFCSVQNHSIAGDHRHPSTKTMTASLPAQVNSTKLSQSTDEDFNVELGTQEPKIIALQEDITNGQLWTVDSSPNQHSLEEIDLEQQSVVKSISKDGDDHHLNKGQGVDVKSNEGGDDGGTVNYGSEGFKKERRVLEEMLSKLNPMAKEFVPPSLFIHNPHFLPPAALGHFGYNANGFLLPDNVGFSNGNSIRRKKSGYNNGKRRMNNRTSMAQQDKVIRRTVYVSDIDHQVTEEQLATLFLHCGQVVDCRVCGDPNSVLRFAFIEFTDEEGAYNALDISGTMLGFYPVKVQPSKTAIAPVNSTFLPQSEDEREMCARTIYCTNIDKKVTPAEIKLFFENMCGEVQRLRLLGDYHHSTRIAFVEFVMAGSAIAALNFSGAIIGSLPLRVSPSKTPVRLRPPRPTMHY